MQQSHLFLSIHPQIHEVYSQQNVRKHIFLAAMCLVPSYSVGRRGHHARHNLFIFPLNLCLLPMCTCRQVLRKCAVTLFTLKLVHSLFSYTIQGGGPLRTTCFINILSLLVLDTDVYLNANVEQMCCHTGYTQNAQYFVK